MDKKPIDKRRRNLLKILALGGGVLVLGKIFNEIKSFKNTSSSKEFSQFDVKEDQKKFVISSKSGEEIFIMDNEQ